MQLSFHPDVPEWARDGLAKPASRYFYGDGPYFVRMAEPMKTDYFNRPDGPIDKLAAHQVFTFVFEADVRGVRVRLG